MDWSLDEVGKKGVVNNLYRLLPLLIVLALSPNSEKKLESLNSFIIATKDTVSSIKNGVDTFHAAMVPFMNGQESNKNASSPQPENPEESESDMSDKSGKKDADTTKFL